MDQNGEENGIGEGEDIADDNIGGEVVVDEAMAESPDEDAGAGGSDMEPRSDSDGEEEQFDIALAASHSYMGSTLQPVSGRSVLEAGWEGRVPVFAHHGAVFPGETVPMLLPNVADTMIIADAIKQDRLFGLLCPDESGTVISGYGSLCEVFEAAFEGEEGEAGRPGRVGTLPPGVTFKARAVHRFRFADLPKHSVPLHLYARLKYERIRILPEISPGDPLSSARLTSLDPYRRIPPHTPLDRTIRTMDAMARPWPLFVYEIFDYHRMRAVIYDYFKGLSLADTLPSEPVSLSFWVARNLALSARDQLALFVVDNALLRLHMAVRDITRKSVLCCASCATEIARREHIFPMSSEGVHGNYTNLGGYMHDIVTVSRASNVELSGGPSAEFSWFPGYTWSIAACGACLQHIGWRFDAMKRSLRPQQFFGLCRNYVTPRAADTAPLPPLAPCALAPRAPPGTPPPRLAAMGRAMPLELTREVL